MKQLKKIIIGLLLIVLAVPVLAACNTNSNANPESVAKTYISSIAKMDYNLEKKCYDESVETTGIVRYTKEEYDSLIASLTKEDKNEWKSYKFLSYEKISGDDSGEYGLINYSYKLDGKGEAIEHSLKTTFVKVNNKWFIKSFLITFE